MYRLIGEDATHYHVHHAGLGAMSLAKGGMTPDEHTIIQSLPHYAFGTDQAGNPELANFRSALPGMDWGSYQGAAAPPGWAPPGPTMVLDPAQPGAGLAPPPEPAPLPPVRPPTVADDMAQRTAATPPAAPASPASAPVPDYIAQGYEAADRLLRGADVSGAVNASLARGRGETAAAGKLETEAATKQAEQQQPILEQATRDRQQLMAYQQQEYQRLNAESTQNRDWLRSNPVDPQRFWTSKDTAGKVSSVLGILISGLNPTAGARNGAVDMLNASIQRDMEAQKATIAQHEELGREIQAQYGSLDNYMAHRLTLAQDYVHTQLESVANQYKGTAAAVNAQRTLAAWDANAAHAQSGLAGARAEIAMQRAQLVQQRVQREAMARLYSGQATPADVRNALSTGAVPPGMMVNTDTAGSQGIARSEASAKALGEQLPTTLSAQEIVRDMQGLEQRYGVSVAAWPTDAKAAYESKLHLLSLEGARGLSGAMSDEEVKHIKEAAGTGLANWFHQGVQLDSMAKALEDKRRFLVQQHTIPLRLPSAAPAPAAAPSPAGAPPAAGAGGYVKLAGRPGLFRDLGGGRYQQVQ